MLMVLYHQNKIWWREIPTAPVRFLMKLTGRHWRLEIYWHIEVSVFAPAYPVLLPMLTKFKALNLHSMSSCVCELYSTLFLRYCLIINTEMDRCPKKISPWSLKLYWFCHFRVIVLAFISINGKTNATQHHYPKTCCYYKAEVSQT